MLDQRDEVFTSIIAVHGEKGAQIVSVTASVIVLYKTAMAFKITDAIEQGMSKKAVELLQHKSAESCEDLISRMVSLMTESYTEEQAEELLLSSMGVVKIMEGNLAKGFE